MSQTKAKKLSESEDEELDVLMQKESRVVQYKTEDFTEINQRANKSHALSKKERRKLKKIKKL